jgi:hypothetical protein
VKSAIGSGKMVLQTLIIGAIPLFFCDQAAALPVTARLAWRAATVLGGINTVAPKISRNQ